MRRENEDVVSLRGRKIRQRQIEVEESDEGENNFPLNQEAAEGFDDDDTQVDPLEAPDVEEPAPGVDSPPPEPDFNPLPDEDLSEPEAEAEPDEGPPFLR